MDYLASLRLFRTVVETKSFARAAEILGVSPSVVSRTIATLEQRFGARLFHRTTRHISLTEAAEQIFLTCSRVLDELETMESVGVRGATTPTGVLRIAAHTTVAVGRLMPLFASFRRLYPSVGLDMMLTERPVDLVQDGCDVAIVLPFMLTTETTVTRLLECMPVALVATPEYLATRAKSHFPTEPAHLADYDFVAMHPSIRKPELRFLVNGEEITVPVKTEVTSNNAMLNRQLVLESFGIGVMAEALVREELASGKLIKILDKYPVLEGSIELRIAYSSKVLLPAKVRAFIDHALAFFESAP